MPSWTPYPVGKAFSLKTSDSLTWHRSYVCVERHLPEPLGVKLRNAVVRVSCQERLQPRARSFCIFRIERGVNRFPGVDKGALLFVAPAAPAAQLEDREFCGKTLWADAVDAAEEEF